jgi:hypothetical protein
MWTAILNQGAGRDKIERPWISWTTSANGPRVLLFQNEDHLWTDFKARAMVDWWDWAPYAKQIEEAAIRRLRNKVENGQA